MSQFSDFTFESSTGKNTIHVLQCLPDEGVPLRGVVQIAHGIAEHMERYREFMSFLASNGFAVAGNDHLGHGKSILSEYDKGIFAGKDGWNYAVGDMFCLHRIMKKKYPDVPYILFGHSMGSFLARTYLIDHPHNFDLAILSGTGMQPSYMVGAGFLLSDLLTKVKGVRSDGKMLNDIAFGTYCDKIENPQTPFDWLSTDAERVQSYIDDPLCGFVAKTSLYRDMMGGIRYICNKKNIAKMDVTKPVYFMSGDADPVGDYGKGVEKAYRAFCDAGMKDVSIRLYPGGRHEMLNESNRDKVCEDILAWISARI